MTEQTLTLAEAANHLGVHYMTAYRYVRTGQLPARKAGDRAPLPLGVRCQPRSSGEAPRDQHAGAGSCPAFSIAS